jgi:hypothetical protein
MSEFADSVAEFIKWLRDSNRPAWVLFVVSGGTLLLPHSWLGTLGMAAWIVNYEPWVVVICALSLTWLATHPFVVWHHHYQVIERIRHAGADEQFTLSEFIRTNHVIQCIGWSHAPSASSLIKDKILFDTGKRDGGDSPYLGIDPWVFQYLKRHKEIVGLKTE